MVEAIKLHQLYLTVEDNFNAGNLTAEQFKTCADSLQEMARLMAVTEAYNRLIKE